MTDERYDYTQTVPQIGMPRISERDMARAAAAKQIARLEGIKADTGKTRMDLIPPELFEGVGAILTFGAKKYGERNWELGMSWGRVYGALLRHLTAWQKGENLDPETGKSHLWHAGCCIAFLIAYEARGIGTDDRK